MPNLKRVLRNKLKDAEKIAVLGIGSQLRGDDAAGLLIATNLKARLKKISGESRLKVFLGGTAPENFTGEIKKFNPTHLVIVDSADTGKKAGAITLLKPEEVKGVSFSTHRLPLTIMINYLLAYLNCEIIIIGIQPKALDFNGPLSCEVEKSAQRISEAIAKDLCRSN